MCWIGVRHCNGFGDHCSSGVLWLLWITVAKVIILDLCGSLWVSMARVLALWTFVDYCGQRSNSMDFCGFCESLGHFQWFANGDRIVSILWRLSNQKWMFVGLHSWNYSSKALYTAWMCLVIGIWYLLQLSTSQKPFQRFSYQCDFGSRFGWCLTLIFLHEHCIHTLTNFISMFNSCCHFLL